MQAIGKAVMKVLAVIAAVSFAMGVTSKTALASSSCSSPWLQVHCERVYFEVCGLPEGCTTNWVDLSGIKNQS